ncbi:MAG: hypothetical protein AAF726_10250 [Planctomycetota bacterium]
MRRFLVPLSLAAAVAVALLSVGLSWRDLGALQAAAPRERR